MRATEMWTAVAIVVVGVAVGALAGWLLARRLRRARPIVRRPVALLAALAVAAAAVLGCAHLMLDRSAAARAIVWMEADTGDWRRFPARAVPAGAEPLAFRRALLPDEELEGITGDPELMTLLEETGTTAFLVLRGEDVLVERYLAGASASSTQTSFSVAKSWLSALVGIAVDRGEIGSIEDPVTAYVPELLERDARFEQITLRHLLTMSSGLRYDEAGMPWSDDTLTYYAPDLRAVALSADVVEPPGRRWHYNNYNPLLIGLVLERATGRPVADYLSEVLWQPMGAEADGSWSLDSDASGFEKMESGLNARAMDFARLGYLFAHDGAVAGRQVVPAAWVSAATANDVSTDPAAHYQLGWWVDTERPGRFYARGNHGQFIYVDPVTDVVVVRTGTRAGLEGNAWPALLRAVADHVEARDAP
ncbi:serine hydrolase domain-containing protein [Georgenia faecalis]|uniref:serine hydrolase domain-containing protein n=1 Tax=Georgenia faecalis TaxID=2483799 RepID=UPI000FDC7F5C|nr:serine hydrolase [Georgenia faecalis]